MLAMKSQLAGAAGAGAGAGAALASSFVTACSEASRGAGGRLKKRASSGLLLESAAEGRVEKAAS